MRLRRITIWAVCLAAVNFVALNVLDRALLRPMAGDIAPPDARVFGYSAETFRNWAIQLEMSGGVPAYGRLHIFGFDLLFPLLLSVAVALLIHNVLMRFPRFARQPSAMRILVPAAFVLPYLMFDLFENWTVHLALADVASIPDRLASTASAYTVLKFVFIALAFAALGVFWLASLKYRAKDAPAR